MLGLASVLRSLSVLRSTFAMIVFASGGALGARAAGGLGRVALITGGSTRD
jgi:hypothetical protein